MGLKSYHWRKFCLGVIALAAPLVQGYGILVVDVGQTLSGEGPINEDVIVNGTASPGNDSIATLVINGNYTQNPNSFYDVDIDNTDSSDSIAVSGLATLNGGSVAVDSLDGTFLIDVPYAILVAAQGITGSGYANATQSVDPYNYLQPYLSYPFGGVEVTLYTDFESFAERGNQLQVALQVDSIVDPSDDLQFVLQNLVVIPPSELGDALDQLSGEQYTSLFQISQASNRHFLRDLYGPMLFGIGIAPMDCCDQDDCESDDYHSFEVWQTTHYGRSNLKGNHGARGFKVSNVDVALGLQTDICDCWKAGIAGYYEYDRLNFNLNGKAQVNIVRAALYSIYQEDCFYGLADLVFGYSHFDVKRDIEFLEVNENARSAPKVYDVSFYTEGGLNYCVCDGLYLQPFLGVEAGYYWHNHFHESGAFPLNLEARRQQLWACDSRLGLRATATLDCDIVISADVAWQHWYSDDDNKIHMQFEDFGYGYHIKGPKQNRDVVDGSLYIGQTFCENMTIFARAFGERSKNYSNYSVAIGFNYKI